MYAIESSVKATDFITDLGDVFINQTKQITFVGNKSGEGYFDSTGKKIIFQSERFQQNPFYQIYTLDLVSGQTKLLSPGIGKTTCAWIHPLGQKAMWSSTHLDPKAKEKELTEIEDRKKAIKAKYSWSFDEAYDIFESDLNGKKIKQLTKERGYDAEGSYSPDGKWIVFASNRSGYTDHLSDEDKVLFEKDPSSQMEIYIMSSDGQSVKRLTNSLGYDGGPFFSSDGKKITWRRFNKLGTSAEIYTMNIDGSEQKQITHLNSMSWAPFYHPSGQYIVFSSSFLGFSNFELFIVDSNGLKKPIRITFDDGFDGLASFSPDGKKITWTRRNEKGESQIYLADWNHEKAMQSLDLGGSVQPISNLSHYQFKPSIDGADLKRIVYTLSSKESAGRASGSEPEKTITSEINKLFSRWGLKPVVSSLNQTMIQAFDVITGVQLKDENQLEINAQAKKIDVDFKPLSLSSLGSFDGSDIVFVGFGIVAAASEKQPAHDDYQKSDIKNKWVILLKDLPNSLSTERRNHLLPYSSLGHKITVAKNKGARGVFVLDSLLDSNKDQLPKQKFLGSSSGLPVLEISMKVAKEIFGWKSETLNHWKEFLNQGKSLESDIQVKTSIKVKTNFELSKTTARQIIGEIKVPKAKGTFIIGAHLDHLGQGEQGNSLKTSDDTEDIHFGADDNASGSAVVIELAHYFSTLKQRKKLSYNLIFALWSAEEIGTLGSKAFIEAFEKETQRKIKDTLALNLNLDMVGRLKDKLYIQGVGSASQWSELIETSAGQTPLALSLQHDPYLPTDSITFYLNQIPSINFFTGVHSDYHTPKDTADKINYPGLIEITKFAHIFISKLNESRSLPTYQHVEGGFRRDGTERSFRIYLGTIPDYSQEGVKGVTISGVSKNSPAEKGGLMAKDTIIEFNGKPIDSIHDYVFSLQSAEPNKTVPIKVKRNNSEITLSITPVVK